MSQYKFDRSCKSCHVRWGQSGDAMHARLQLTWDSPGGSSFLYLLCPDTQTSAQPDRKKESVRACGSCTAYISAALHTAGYCARSKRILWDVYGAVMAVMQHHYAIHDNGNMLDPKYVYRTKVLLCFLKLRTNLLISLGDEISKKGVWKGRRAFPQFSSSSNWETQSKACAQPCHS